MSFRKAGATGYTDERADNYLADLDSPNDEKKFRPNHKIDKGDNFYIWFPTFSAYNPFPFRQIAIHYAIQHESGDGVKPGKCFHVCLRDDAVETRRGWRSTSGFNDCPHCNMAWQEWLRGAKDAGVDFREYKYRDAERKDPYPEFAFFKRNMPSDQGLILALCITPFLEVRNDRVVAREDVVGEHWVTFMEVVGQVTSGESPDADLLESLPEDVRDAALIGVKPMLVGMTVLDFMRKSYASRKSDLVMDDITDDDGSPVTDPLMVPERYVLHISKTPGSKVLDNGSKVSEYNATLTRHNLFKSLGVSNTFWDTIVALSQDGLIPDIHAIDDGEYENVRDKISHYARTTTAELEEIMEDLLRRDTEANGITEPEPRQDVGSTPQPRNAEAFDPNNLALPTGARQIPRSGAVDLVALKRQVGMTTASELEGDA